MWGQQGGQGFGQQQQAYWTEQAGGHGGSAGQFVGPNYSLVAARGRHGQCLDQIQFLFVDINTGQFHQTQRVGGNGGGEWMFQSPPGQWINSVTVHVKHNRVEGLQFQTNASTKSQAYGSCEGVTKHLGNKQGTRITGVRWRAGQLIDALSFMIAH